MIILYHRNLDRKKKKGQLKAQMNKFIYPTRHPGHL